jgi:hypothetical protein
MKTIYFAAVLLTTLGLAACEKQPVVVNVPTPVAVPGPAGPQGAAGTDGSQGATGATGKTGEGTTVIVMPPASTPAN